MIALSALGALHAGFILYAMPETNMKVSQGGPVWIGNVLRNFDFSTMNPLSFMRLFYGDGDIQKAQNTKYRQLNSAVNAVEKIAALSSGSFWYRRFKVFWRAKM